MKEHKTKEGYFKLLKKTFIEMDKRYIVLIILELLLVMAILGSLGVLKYGFNTNIMRLQPITSQEVVDNPYSILDLEFQPTKILSSMILYFLGFFLFNLFIYTYIKSIEYRIIQKNSKMDFKNVANFKNYRKFLFLNLIWWVCTLLLIIFMMFVITNVFLVSQATGSLMTLNAIVIVGSFVILILLWYLKSLTNVLFFEGNLTLKNLINQWKKVHYFIPYGFVMFLIWFFIYGTFGRINGVFLFFLMALVYSYMVTYTRFFTLKLIK